MKAQPSYSRADERDLEFAGFLTFLDRPKNDAASAIAALATLGRVGQDDHRRQQGSGAVRDHARRVAEGRRTFANTLKYVLTTMSANLGNMISMAAASLFLPFLPLLPGQILLNNFVGAGPNDGSTGAR